MSNNCSLCVQGTRPLRPPHAKQAGIKPRNLDLSIDANVEDSFQISPRGIDNEESTVSSEDAEEVKNDSVQVRPPAHGMQWWWSIYATSMPKHDLRSLLQVLVRIRPPTEQETCDCEQRPFELPSTLPCFRSVHIRSVTPYST